MINKIRKYQIVERENSTNHAGAKAPRDISVILEDMNFKKLEEKNIETRTKNIFSIIQKLLIQVKQWIHFYLEVERKAIVFVQYTAKPNKILKILAIILLVLLKQVKVIYLLHDINKIRGVKDTFEYKIIAKYATVVIVHNLYMKKYFIENTKYKKNVVTLNLFDYLHENIDTCKEHKIEKRILIAGNLDFQKTKYIYELIKNTNIPIILYGPNYKKTSLYNSLVWYRGEFTPEELPFHMESGFGLIWDGSSTSTCEGKYGNYLRFNNPHKFSLYLAAGIPVIAWENSAIAKMVKEEKIGILVKSLEEIEYKLSILTEEEIRKLYKNVCILQEKVISGQFTRAAVKKAEEYINNIVTP